MTTQTQVSVPRPAAEHGKRLAWFWRIVNTAVILAGILCGYSLESRHNASAAEIPATQIGANAANGIQAPMISVRAWRSRGM